MILPILILAVLTGCSGKPEKEEFTLSAVSVTVSDEDESEAPDEDEDEDEDSTDDTGKKKPSRKVRKAMRKMSVQDKVCQMFVAAPEAVAWYEGMLFTDYWFDSCYQEYPVGGFIYDSGNFSYTEQVRQLLDGAQQSAKNKGVGAFQMIAEEGGETAPLCNTLGTVTAVKSMSKYGELNDADKAYVAGRTIGEYLADLGFNVDLAPVVDVAVEENNELGDRIFSSDPIVVSDMSGAFMEGLNSKKVCAALKHFPGLGASVESSDFVPVHIDRTYEQLTYEEFPAFRNGIDAGVDFVMVGHQITSASGDDLPGDLSPVVINDWLRDELGFEGIVITDSHSKGGIYGVYAADEAAVMAIQAGADMILMPSDLRAAVDGVVAAVDSGKIKEERIDESVIRILEKKEEMGLI